MKSSRVMHSLFFAALQLVCKRVLWGVITFTKCKKTKYNDVAALYNARQETFSHLNNFALGLPFELTHYWQQYPWVFGESLCRGRSMVSEM